MAAGDLITSDYQIEWRGVLLGNSSVYGLRSLEGWVDLPSFRVGVEPRSGRHGAFATQLLSEHRTVTAELLIGGLPVDFYARIKELKRITTSSENADEEPIVIQWDGYKHMAMARCMRRTIPAEYDRYPLGRAMATVQWIASDPRQFLLPIASASAGLPIVSGGLVFPPVFPLDFGAGASGGSFTITNNGNADAWPIFHMVGPMTAPVVRNTTTGKALIFKSSTSVPAGQTWELDTDARTVTVLGTATGRNNELLIRDWFAIPPGETHSIQLSSTTFHADARLLASWYHTDM